MNCRKAGPHLSSSSKGENLERPHVTICELTFPGALVQSVLTLTLEDSTDWEKHRGLTMQGDGGACDKMGV